MSHATRYWQRKKALQEQQAARERELAAEQQADELDPDAQGGSGSLLAAHRESERLSTEQIAAHEAEEERREAESLEEAGQDGAGL